MNNTTTTRRGPGRPPDPDKRFERKKTILDQAVIHFARNGFARTDVGTIAKAAGCSKGTVYNYFDNKQALFREAVDHVMEGLVQAATSHSEEGAVEGFSQAVRAYLRYFDENPTYIELLIQEQEVFKDKDMPPHMEYCRTYQNEHGSFFKRLSEVGAFRDVPAGRLFDIISDLLYGTIFANYFAKRKICPEQQANDITTLLLNGLLDRS